MMRTLTTGVMLLAFAGLRAQNANVVSAYNYMQDGDLAKAAEYIEPAIGNETTAAKEKTWRYRGDIYRMMALGDDAALKAQFPDAMQKAIDSYLKANELDLKGTYKTDNMRSLGALQAASLNAGNDAFAAKDYDKAIALYDNSQRIAETFGQVDSLAAFNTALAYESKGDGARAIESYRECLAMGYKKADIYRFIAVQQKKAGDLNGAVETTREGRAQFPGNKDLVQDELSFLLEAGRDAEAEKTVQDAIAGDPNNPVFYSVLGSLYDAKANPKEGQAPAEADVAKWTDLAEEAYKKSIEKDPTFFDAYFNVGVLYNNRAAGCYDKANAIKDNAQYAKAKAACDEVYRKAIPYFEKAHELRPDDAPTIQQLMKLYANINDQTKYDALKAKLDALKSN